jgi:hypothetical protein
MVKNARGIRLELDDGFVRLDLGNGFTQLYLGALRF